MKKQRDISKLKLPLIFTALFVAAIPLSGCDRDEGGLEEAAENTEEAMTDFGNTVEDKCEEAKSGMNAEDTDC